MVKDEEERFKNIEERATKKEKECNEELKGKNEILDQYTNINKDNKDFVSKLERDREMLIEELTNIINYKNGLIDSVHEVSNNFMNSLDTYHNDLTNQMSSNNNNQKLTL